MQIGRRRRSGGGVEEEEKDKLGGGEEEKENRREVGLKRGRGQMLEAGRIVFFCILLG